MATMVTVAAAKPCLWSLNQAVSSPASSKSHVRIMPCQMSLRSASVREQLNAGHRNASLVSRQAQHSGRARVGSWRAFTPSALASEAETALQETEVVAEAEPAEMAMSSTPEVEPSVPEATPSEPEAELAAEVQAAPSVERRTQRREGGNNRRNVTVQIEDVQVGQSYSGKVISIQSYGAFVDIGTTTDGLVHISELSAEYVRDISSILSLGQQITVTVKEVEKEKKRIALSMRNREAEAAAAAAGGSSDRPENRRRSSAGGDSGGEVEGGRAVNRGKIAGQGKGRQSKEDRPAHNFKKGQMVTGTVKNIAKFGAFVELSEGVEGLLHGSEISAAGEFSSIETMLTVGQKVEVRILRIERAKISLSMKEEVDMTEVNSSMNTSTSSSEASNPFTAAFKKANLIPEPEPEEVPAETVAEETTVAEEPVAEEVGEESSASEATVDAVGEEPVAEEVGEGSSVPEATVEAVAEVATEPQVEEEATAAPESESIPEEAPSEPVAEVVAEPEATVVPEEVAEVDAPEAVAALLASSEAGEVGTEEKVEEVSAEVAEEETEVVAESAPAEAEPVPDFSEEPAAETVVSAEVAEEETEVVAEAAPAESEPVPDVSEEPAAETVVSGAVVETEEKVEEEKVEEPVAEAEPVAEVAEEPAAETAVPEEEGSAQQTAEQEAVPEADPSPVAETEASAAASEVTGSEVPPLDASEVQEVEVEEKVEEVKVEEPSSTGESADVARGETEEGVETVPGGVEVASVPDTSVEGTNAAAVAAVALPVSELVVAAVLASVVASAAEKAAEFGGVSAAVVKTLREDSGAGMMDCKKALTEANGDLEKAKELLRKKGLASADKKATRIATEGLIHSYVHDGRIGVLLEVNCETDFVSRGAAFRELVEDLAMQVVACPQVEVVSVDNIPVDQIEKERAIEMQKEDLLSKKEEVRGMIVDGRIAKRCNELALLEQPYIKNDKILVKDLIKEAVAKIGENIQVRRFKKFNLGEGLAKKSEDFAAEVAAASAVEVKKEEEKVLEPETTESAAPEVAEIATIAVSASAVKELRASTGAGMMDCKKALAANDNDVEKATEYLRKKGLASADKKSSRMASEGLIGSYIHDGRIGVLLEVNCETDFVSRGEKFGELVKELAMQVVACPDVQFVSTDEVDVEVVAKEREIEMGREDLQSKPDAIRGKIVDGRMAKRLGELALLEQEYIRDDKILVKDLVKQTVAALGENIQVRRFERFTLGEGLEKKSVDFAAEVAAAAVA